MKRMKLTTLFLGAAIVGGTLSPTLTEAAQQGTSPATVEFTAGTLPDGNGGDDTKDPDEDGSNTTFDLLYVPEEFHFASTSIQATNIATTGISIDPNRASKEGLNLTEKRYGVGDVRGTKAGWHVNATISDMENGTDKLAGSIDFNQTGGYAKHDGTIYNRDVTGFSTDADAPTFNNQVSVPIGGEATTIASAAVNKGQGTWDSELSNIKLKVSTPSSSLKAGSYAGTITWDLVTGP